MSQTGINKGLDEAAHGGRGSHHAGSQPSEPVNMDVAPASEAGPGRRLPLRALRFLWHSIWRLWLFVTIVLLWWFLSADSTSPFFPPLKSILSRLWDLWIVGDAAQTLKPSLIHFAVGYFIAGVLGVAVAAFLWRFPRVNGAVSPLLYFVYVIPSVAILPAVMALMGLGSGMKITIVVLASIWPTLLNALDGMRAVDQTKLDAAKVMHLSSGRTVWSVVLPAAMPQIMAGLRYSLQIAVIMMVVSEFVASTSGIGFFILNAQEQFAITDMWTGIIVLGLIGSALAFIFLAVERVVLRWYIGARSVQEKG